MPNEEINVSKEQQLVSEIEEERTKRVKSCLEEVTKILEKYQCRLDIQGTIIFTPMQVKKEEEKTA
jgi:hypothetical protein